MKTRLLLLVLALAFGLPFDAARAQTGGDNPTGVTGSYNGEITTGGMYDPYTQNMKRVVTDMVVPGCAGSYPLKVTRYYNSRANTTASWNFGFNWTKTMADVVKAPDGRSWDWGVDANPIPHGIEEQYYGDGVGLPDGGSVSFESASYTQSNGTVVTYYRENLLCDPHSNCQSYTYASNSIQTDFLGWSRLMRVTESGGHYLAFTYNTDAGGNPLDTTIQSYDSNNVPLEKVHYIYGVWTSSGGYTQRILTQVDYDDGTHAYYTYKNGNVDTKYPLLGSCQDVRFGGPMERIEYDYKAIAKNPTDPGANTLAHGVLQRERRLIPGQVDAGETVSTVTVDTDYSKRIETRGDGTTRNFFYQIGVNNGGRLDHYQDFLHNPHTFLTYYLSTDPAWGFMKDRTDPRGNKTTYSRTGPAIDSVIHPDGNHVDYTYGPWPFQTSKTDENGKLYTFHRDLYNRIIQIDSPDGSYEYFTYNAASQVTVHQLKNGAFEYFAYDPVSRFLTDQWNPTSTTPLNPSEPHVHFDYYGAGSPWDGRLMKKTLPANASGQIATETYEYDKAYLNGVTGTTPCPGRGLLTRVTYADGNAKTFTYDIYGNKLTETNELNQTTSYTYDEYKRVLSVSDPMAHTTRYSYQDIFGSALSSYAHTSNCVRDLTDPAGVVTRSTYDLDCRKISTTVAYGTALAATSTMTYDANGNPLIATDPLGHKTSTTYDNRDRKSTVTAAYSDLLAQTTTFTYDPASNVLNILRPDGKNIVKTYDAMNRVLTDNQPVDATHTKVTSFTYEIPAITPNNGSGLLHTVTDADSNTTTFGYDTAGHKTLMTYPSGETEGWGYDNVYNPVWRRTVNGTTQRFDLYDNRNRNTHMYWTNDSNRPEFVADSATFGYDAASRMTSATNQNSTVTRTYDAAGRLTSDNQAVTGAGGTYNLTYTYDQNSNSGRLTEMSANSVAAYDARYTYDAAGRLQYIGDQWRGNTVQYSYDLAGNVTQRTTLLDGNTQQNYGTRDALNRLPNRSIVNGATTVSNETYSYDILSRLTNVARTEDNKSDSFGYNYASEMTSAQYGLVGGVNPNRAVGYTLDLVGNRNQTTDTTATTQSYAPNNLNQYTGGVGTNAIVNGSEHEVSNYQGVAYQYINDGRLTHVTSGANTYDIKYDALGRAVIRTLNNQTTYYLYDGEKALNEAGYNNATNVYGPGVDENVIRFEPANVYYFYQDHEGSVTHVRAVTTGATIESYRYDAFGQPTIRNASGTQLSTSAINNRFMFTGREWAPVNFGFYEYRARAYHPGLGRFMSEDPKGFAAGDYNLFRYCGNDPEDRVDPMGLNAIFSASGDWARIANNGENIGGESGGGSSGGGGSSPKADQAGGGSDAGTVENSTSGYISGGPEGNFTVSGRPMSATGTGVGASASVITTKYFNSGDGYKIHDLRTEIRTGTIDRGGNIHWDKAMHKDTPENGLKPALIIHEKNGVTRIDAAGKLITGSRRPGSNIVNRNAAKPVREFSPFIQEFRVSAWGSNGTNGGEYLGSISYSAAYDQHSAPVYTGFGEHIPAGY